MAQPLDVGDTAPDFTLTDGTGTQVNLAKMLNAGPAVVFFYPKDNTPGCTQEVCAFRDHMEDFIAAGAQVVGISRDDQQAHEAFSRAHKLSYPLLSDPGGEVAGRFGVGKTLGLMPGRVTFVIGSDHVVHHRHAGQLQIRRHIDSALAHVRALAQKADGA